MTKSGTLTKGISLGLFFVVLISAWLYLSLKPNAQIVVDMSQNINWQIAPKDLANQCASAQDELTSQIEAMESLDEKDSTSLPVVFRLESALTSFRLKTEPLAFLKYVSANAKVRQASDKCESESAKLMVDIFAREKLFLLVKAYNEKKPDLKGEDLLLSTEYYKDFRRNGLELPADKRAILKAKQKELVDLTSQFSTRVNEWKNPTELSRADLAGLSDEFINGLEKSKIKPEHFVVNLQYPQYFPIMENAKNPEVRKLLQGKFETRGGKENRLLLQKAIILRNEMAQLLGYKTHAEYVLAEKMAKTPEQVRVFLADLKEKLKPYATDDLKELSALKVAEYGPAADSQIALWEWRYYANQLKKTKYSIDQEKIKEYFPLDVVLTGMFDIYQTLFGVRFYEIPGAATWHEGVKKYRVTREGSDQTIAFFYMDLFPRDNKYSHAAAFTLLSGHQINNDQYLAPVASIVANFSAPTASRPALLLHDEVETMLHEFGHIMHQILTKAKYASFSGTNVKGDFVEAPSQMLENWAWQNESLKKLSSHYKTKTALPADLMEKMILAKRASRAIGYMRQLLFASVDMAYHDQPSTAPIETTNIFHDFLEDITMLKSQRDTYPEASFGHLMGGYDAGYYGYLWSEVFAADMFSRFKKEGLFNADTGSDYLTAILEPGGSADPYDLIAKFLGRAPNEQAFLQDFDVNLSKK